MKHSLLLSTALLAAAVAPARAGGASSMTGAAGRAASRGPLSLLPFPSDRAGAALSELRPDWLAAEGVPQALRAVLAPGEATDPVVLDALAAVQPYLDFQRELEPGANPILEAAIAMQSHAKDLADAATAEGVEEADLAQAVAGLEQVALRYAPFLSATFLPGSPMDMPRLESFVRGARARLEEMRRAKVVASVSATAEALGQTREASGVEPNARRGGFARLRAELFANDESREKIAIGRIRVGAVTSPRERAKGAVIALLDSYLQWNEDEAPQRQALEAIASIGLSGTMLDTQRAAARALAAYAGVPDNLAADEAVRQLERLGRESEQARPEVVAALRDAAAAASEDYGRARMFAAAADRLAAGTGAVVASIPAPIPAAAKPGSAIKGWKEHLAAWASILAVGGTAIALLKLGAPVIAAVVVMGGLAWLASEGIAHGRGRLTAAHLALLAASALLTAALGTPLSPVRLFEGDPAAAHAAAGIAIWLAALGVAVAGFRYRVSWWWTASLTAAWMLLLQGLVNGERIGALLQSWLG